MKMRQTQSQRQGRWVQKWRIESHSEPGKFYTVSVSSEMVWGCSCPKWIFRRQLCDHVREVQLSLKLGEGDSTAEMRIIAIQIERMKKQGMSDEDIADALAGVNAKPMQEFYEEARV